MTRLLVVCLLVWAATAIAQEKITLTSPETKPSNTSYRVGRLTLDLSLKTVKIQLEGDTAETVVCEYSNRTTPTGATLLTALNKANLSTAYAGNASTGSLAQRLFHRLVVMKEADVVCDKSLTGTLTGSPQ